MGGVHTGKHISPPLNVVLQIASRSLPYFRLNFVWEGVFQEKKAQSCLELAVVQFFGL